MATFGLLMAVIVLGSLLAMVVLYGVLRLVGALLRGVAWVLVMWLRASGRAARSAGHALVVHLTPVRHPHRHRHA